MKVIVVKKGDSNDCSDCHNDTEHTIRLHVYGMQLFKHANLLKTIFSDMAMVLKFPLLVAAFWIQCAWIFACLCLTGLYGYWAIGLMIVGLSPVTFIVAKEAWRIYNLLPPSEAWETTSEQWSKTFTEYVEKMRRKNKRI